METVVFLFNLTVGLHSFESFPSNFDFMISARTLVEVASNARIDLKDGVRISQKQFTFKN